MNKMLMIAMVLFGLVAVSHGYCDDDRYPWTRCRRSTLGYDMTQNFDNCGFYNDKFCNLDRTVVPPALGFKFDPDPAYPETHCHGRYGCSRDNADWVRSKPPRYDAAICSWVAKMTKCYDGGLDGNLPGSACSAYLPPKYGNMYSSYMCINHAREQAAAEKAEQAKAEEERKAAANLSTSLGSVVAGASTAASMVLAAVAFATSV